MLPLLLSQKDPGVLGTPPREAPNEGMRRRGLEAPPPPPRESPSAGKHGPQQAPRETPRLGVLGAQECAPTVLRRKILNLKRPFEAKEGDAAGHTGHHKNKSGRIKSASVQAAPQISKSHIPLGTYHYNPPSKSPAIFILRPIEKGVQLEENKVNAATLNVVTCHSRPAVTHARHAQPRTSHRLLVRQHRGHQLSLEYPY